VIVNSPQRGRKADLYTLPKLVRGSSDRFARDVNCTIYFAPQYTTVYPLRGACISATRGTDISCVGFKTDTTRHPTQPSLTGSLLQPVQSMYLRLSYGFCYHTRVTFNKKHPPNWSMLQSRMSTRDHDVSGVLLPINTRGGRWRCNHLPSARRPE
jgi:hypothetical protein